MLNGWLDGLLAIYFGLSALLMYHLMISKDESYKNKLCVMLLHVSTSTVLFHDFIQPNADEIRFIKKPYADPISKICIPDFISLVSIIF